MVTFRVEFARNRSVLCSVASGAYLPRRGGGGGGIGVGVGRGNVPTKNNANGLFFFKG